MIKYLILDVDGTLTDGKIYIGPSGEAMKAFSVKDGYVFKYILQPKNIIPIVITARSSDIVKHRCDELGIREIHQGAHDKKETLLNIVGEKNLANCAYFGDDILDLNCMLPIKEHGGIIGCPHDAVNEVVQISDYVCSHNAGEGALREFVEWLVKDCSELDSTDSKIEAALEHLLSLDTKNITDGKHIVNDDFYYVLQQYKTKSKNEGILESHRKYVDIQIIISGTEVMYTVDTLRLTCQKTYDSEKDIALWNVPGRMAKVTLQEGDYIVLFPENAHMGAISAQESADQVTKIVGKVRIS